MAKRKGKQRVGGDGAAGDGRPLDVHAAPALPPDDLVELHQLAGEPVEPLKPSEASQLRFLLAELASREIEALKLYEPLPIINTFHACRRDERLLRGSNRAGKTLGAAVEFARAVTGADPFGKYPAANGRAFVVGQNQEQLAGVIFRKLFRPGAFKIIRDLATNLWRAFRPKEDRGREADARPAPPLIPARLVKEFSWEDKKRQVPRKATLHNGWEITFFSSGGEPPNGQDIDLFWIDEEIESEAWYSELVARLLDRKGKFFWSATPQVASESLYALHERAEAEDDLVAEFLCLLTDNFHIDDAEKEKLYRRLSPEERRVRYHGEYAASGFRVYPEFDFTKVHAHGSDDEGWQPPPDWARFKATDPGRQVCAVLFLAVPPPELGAFAVVYDELYLKGCDADRYGREVAGKSVHVVWDAMLIDNHAARVHEMGSGLTVEQQYTQALHRHGVEGRDGTYFLPGADDPKAGIEAVRNWLRIRPDGSAYLRVAKGRCPQLRWEVQRYHYKRNARKEVTDEVEKRNDHLMDCLRYLAMYAPKWRKPKVAKSAESAAYRSLQAKLARKRAKQRMGDAAGL
jgi:hypothetical protein